MRVAGIRITRPVVQSRVVILCWNPAELQRCLQEFIMIHHLARAFHARELALAGAHLTETVRPASPPLAQPVKPRPITPWSAPQPSSCGVLAQVIPLRATHGQVSRVRISTDPSDARRTVITGRFAEVCAALDRLVREQEAAA
jgi:hypothetical protein